MEDSFYFNQIPLFNEAKHHAEKTKSRLGPLGDYLCQNNLEKIFGVNLLHRHFSMSTNEFCVRTEIEDGYIIEPSTNDSDLSPYLFDVSGDRLTPIEFLRHKHPDNPENNYFSLLFEHTDMIKNILIQSNLLGSVAIVLKSLPDVNKNTIWVENIISDRKLEVKQYSSTYLESNPTIETHWFFDKEKNIHNSVACGVCCAVHCGIHCGYHGMLKDHAHEDIHG